MSNRKPVIPFRELKSSCNNCLTYKHCLTRELDSRQLEEFDQRARRRRTLHKGELLFRQGDRFRSLFIVQSGAVKAYVISDEGEQQVSGFHFPGDLLGVDGIDRDMQTCNAEALETSSVCEVNFTEFRHLAEQVPSLQRQFFRLISRELGREKTQLLVLGKMHAEQRLAKFILDVYNDLQHRCLPNREFVFPMSRHDIANYLGLAVETVSRLLTRFDGAGLISVQHRRIRILANDRLHALVKGNTDEISQLRHSA